MGQTDPNLAFWEKFWLNFAEKSAIFWPKSIDLG